MGGNLLRILDLGTGTGNLIGAIVANIPGATGVGVDISRAAVRVARRNMKRLGLSDRVKIVRGNFNKVGSLRFEVGGKSELLQTSNFKLQTSYLKPQTSFDIIISNPPYIAVGDSRVDAGARWDPAVALYAGADGLDAYHAIAGNVRPLLKPGGRIYLEIGEGQGPAVWQIFESNGFRYMGSHDDLSGTERVLEFVK